MDAGSGQAGEVTEGDARRQLADASRRVIAELASSTAASAAFTEASGLVQQAADLLAAATHGRPYEGAEASLAAYQERMHIDHSPLVGMLNPLAPPIEMHVAGNAVTGTVTFGTAYEGPPGCVHGGFIAAAFDEVLGFGLSITGRPGMTARLAVDYRSPTPLHQPLLFEAELDRVDGRKLYMKARLTVQADGRLCAQAEGLFVSMNHEVFSRLMHNRLAD